MAIGEAVTLIGALAILIGALSTYRSAMRKADIDALQARMIDAEKRLAFADSRAATYERQANEYRTDVIQLGEELAKERKDNATRLCEMERAYQAKINKLVLAIQSLFNQMRAAGLEPADVDLADLEKMRVIEQTEGAA